MRPSDKPLVWLHGEIKTPPFSRAARLEAGFLLRLLQRGDSLPMPQSRPFPTMGPRCHELRVNDGKVSWRIVYCTEPDAIVILEPELFMRRIRARATSRHGAVAALLRVDGDDVLPVMVSLSNHCDEDVAPEGETSAVPQ